MIKNPKIEIKIDNDVMSQKRVITGIDDSEPDDYDKELDELLIGNDPRLREILDSYAGN
jgi:hypothetical protein